jgi:hypothetical protein
MPKQLSTLIGTVADVMDFDDRVGAFGAVLSENKSAPDAEFILLRKNA